MKLALTAAAALILIALMTALVLQTTSAAQEVVEQAGKSHQRMRVFARLQYTAGDLQTRTYRALRTPTATAIAQKRQARAQFQQALDSFRRLPERTQHEREVAAAVEREGAQVLRLFDHGARIVSAVNAQWRRYGSRAAMQEVQTLSAPYFEFTDTVGREIAREEARVTTATHRALSLQHAVALTAFAGLALGLTLCIAVFVVLLTRLGPGLKRLERGARAFGSGDLNHRIALPGRDELAQLAAIFDSMAQQLSDKQAALQEVTNGLERAVAVRTAELENANAALSAEDERRRTFLADASHELRMPLTIVRGEAQVALRALDGGTIDAAEVFERILEQTRVLTRLLDDLFLIARAEAGGLRLNMQDVDVGDLVTHVAADFATIACELGATVHAHAAADLNVRADPDRLRQALAALIDNALRHTRQGVNIAVEARAEGEWVIVVVADDGPGVDAASASDLFSRFRRGRTRSDGSGLGLTVVRALAEAHGGTAHLENGAQGGARAVLRFPRAAWPLRPDVAAVA